MMKTLFNVKFLYYKIIIFIEAVGALWSLSYDENIRMQMIKDMDCTAIDTFERLMTSPDAKVKGICRKALWTMRDSLVNSKRYKALGKLKLTYSIGC